MNTIRNFFAGLAVAGLLVAAPAQGSDLWDIYQLALKNDPTFAQAQANYQAQLENKAIARAGYLPSLGFNASKSKSHSYGTSPGEITDPVTGASLGFGQVYQSTSGDNTQYGLSLNQHIFDWSAWKALDQADATVAQAEANFAAAQQDLIVRTATAYFNVLNARDTLAADQASKNALAKQLEQAKQKYQVGMSAITDVQEAQAAYDQAVADEIGAQQQVSTTEEQLRAITGQPVGELLEPVPDMPLRSPDPATAKAWVDQALKQNPNLLAAQAAADAASAAIGMKRGSELPTLDLSASYGRSKNSGSFFGTQDTRQGQVMLSLNFPIFSGGGVNAQITQAQRQYDAALDQVKLVTRQTEQQARTAFLGVMTGIAQVTALKQSVQSNQTSMQATEAGMKVGTRTIVDVLTSRQNLLKAQTGFANSRYNYLKSVLQLKQAAGTLSPDDLKKLNALMQIAAPNPEDSAPADTATGQTTG